MQSEILSHCSRNTRRNFTQGENDEEGTMATNIKVASSSAVEVVASKTKAQATARMSLQERLAAVTRGSNSKAPTKQSPTEIKPTPSIEQELREKMELKQKEQESIMKEIEIASEHQSLLGDMLVASASESTDDSSDVNETLDVGVLIFSQCAFTKRLSHEYHSYSDYIYNVKHLRG